MKVAFLYLREHGFDGALERLRSGIQSYNAANNVPDTATSGYNETTTHAFLRLIDATMRAYGELVPTPDADAFCDAHPQLQHRHALALQRVASQQLGFAVAPVPEPETVASMLAGLALLAACRRRRRA